MAITKTGVTLSTSGEQDKTVEQNGSQSSIAVTGLTPSTTYTVSAYVIDSTYGKINAASTSSFTTLQAGDIILSNINAYWDTQEAKFHFECDWASIYPIAGDGQSLANNFRGYVSQNSNFSPQQQVNTGWTRQLDGMTGTINAQPTALIPTTPGSAYYFKLVFVDSQGFEIVKTFSYTTPVVQNGGTFSFNAIASDSSNKNAIWFPTQTTPSTFSYYPSKKRIIATKDNWATICNTSGWKNWPNNGYELFITFEPNNYACRMEIQDIYGNVFRSASDTQVICPQPVLYASADNNKGQLYIYSKINPNLDYTTGNNLCEIYIDCDDDPQYSHTINLATNPQAVRYDYIPVDDGTYNIYLEMISSNYSFNPQETVTVKCVGYLEITDSSTFSEDKMTFRARYQMGKFRADTSTFEVIMWDGNDMRFAQFTPIVTGDDMSGMLTASDGIQLPEGCDYVYYQVEVTNSGGYTNGDEVDISLE